MKIEMKQEVCNILSDISSSLLFSPAGDYAANAFDE